jgi:PAS domain-containing protein
MSQSRIQPSGHETFFGVDEIIVSKTDLKGIILYANETFLKVAGYSESEVLGKPHNIIRHPDMPRCVFKLLWDTISAGNEASEEMAQSADKLGESEQRRKKIADDFESSVRKVVSALTDSALHVNKLPHIFRKQPEPILKKALRQTLNFAPQHTRAAKKLNP